MEKDEKIRKIVEKLFESEIMRSLVTLTLFEKTDLLTPRAISLASMGLSKMAEQGITFPWEPDWNEGNKNESLEI